MKTKYILLILLILFPVPSKAFRCDYIFIKEFSKRQRAECKTNKNSKDCHQLKYDLTDYLLNFHSKNDAACVRMHVKYGIEVIEPYKRNPKRWI